MLTYDLLASLPRAERGLGAHRWGMAPTTARVLAAMLLEPENAARVIRRGIDAGAPQLCRLLVEHGGAAVPRTDALAIEAGRLLGWFPLIEDAAGWCVPRDFAAAAAPCVDRERFFTATLIPRLETDDLVGLFDELGLATEGTHGYKLRAAVERVATAAKDPACSTAAANVRDLQSIRSSDIASVSSIPNTGGLQFRVVLADGEEVDICPREQAELHGQQFAEVRVEKVASVGIEREMPAVRVPAVQEIGALVTFATSRAADECAAHPDFRNLVARRIDDVTLATRSSCSAEHARTLLLGLGFHIDEVALQ